jgi:hypothetical protein
LHPGIQQLTAGRTDVSPEKSEEGVEGDLKKNDTKQLLVPQILASGEISPSL